MDFKVPIINDENKDGFFYNLDVGEAFQFNSSDYIWEDVYNIAISQGKKIKKINDNHFLYKIIGSCGGVIIRDVKSSAENIITEEILRLNGELSKCYKRIDLLESQTGLRGVERLNRCEICKNHILPYQSKIQTDTGEEHTECNLNQIISDLNKSIIKKDETLKKWVKDSQRTGSENQSLRIEIDRLKYELGELQQETNSLISINDTLNIKEKELSNNMKNLEEKNLDNYENIVSLKNINNIQEELLRDIFALIVRTMRFLGDNSNDFLPIPAINLNGEQRIELKGWCKPLFDDWAIILNNIKECL
jgi:hypothetical protein